MGKKKCELCEGVARMFCESDQASLCWDCDGKVHGANFLVAKHTRCLLCSACQSPTSWKASGLRLGPTVTICEFCLARKKNSVSGSNNRCLRQEIVCNGDRLREDDDGAESYDDDEEEESDDDEEEEEEEAENQVVPWDAAAAAQQPPVMSSSSSVSSGEVKRTRQELDLNCSHEESNESRPLKRLSRNETSSRSTAVMKPALSLNGERKSNGCDTSSSSSTLVLETANKSRCLSR